MNSPSPRHDGGGATASVPTLSRQSTASSLRLAVRALAVTAFASLLLTDLGAAAAVPGISRAAILALRDDGAFEPALDMAETLLESTPKDADLLLLKGQLQAFLAAYPEALETLASAAELAPDYLDIYLMQARVHVYAERPEAALALLRGRVPPDLARGDAQLLLGRVALAAGETATARTAFAQAVRLDAGSGAAWLGLGDTALAMASTEVAALNYERALAIPETAPVARERLAALAEAGRRFALTSDFSFSRFNDQSDDWREGGLTLDWRIDDRRQLAAGFSLVQRFAMTDTQANLRFDARLGAKSGYVLGAALAPGADFLPTWKLRAGFDHQLYEDVAWPATSALGAGVGFVEATLADYADGLVQSVETGLVQYAFEGRAWATAEIGGTYDATGGFDPSFGLRLDVQVDDASRVFFGLAQAFEKSGSGAGTTRSYYGGLDHALTDRLDLLASLALEDRARGVRQTTFSLGVRVAF